MKRPSFRSYDDRFVLMHWVVSLSPPRALQKAIKLVKHFLMVTESSHQKFVNSQIINNIIYNYIDG